MATLKGSRYENAGLAPILPNGALYDPDRLSLPAFNVAMRKAEETDLALVSGWTWSRDPRNRHRTTVRTRQGVSL